MLEWNNNDRGGGIIKSTVQKRLHPFISLWLSRPVLVSTLAPASYPVPRDRNRFICPSTRQCRKAQASRGKTLTGQPSQEQLAPQLQAPEEQPQFPFMVLTVLSHVQLVQLHVPVAQPQFAFMVMVGWCVKAGWCFERKAARGGYRNELQAEPSYRTPARLVRSRSEWGVSDLCGGVDQLPR